MARLDLWERRAEAMAEHDKFLAAGECSACLRSSFEGDRHTLLELDGVLRCVVELAGMKYDSEIIDSGFWKDDVLWFCMVGSENQIYKCQKLFPKLLRL